MNFLSQKRSKTLLTKTNSTPPEETPFNNFYYKDVAKLTGSGGWSVNFQEKKSFLDPEARRILKTPDDYIPSLKTALDFYAPEHKQKATEAFMACSMGKPFSTSVKMITYDQEKFWARAVGRPVFGENEEIIGIQGVFQDINDEKMKELELESSIRVIESQNSRLFNFAHIVSHNLRSHASNLHLTLDLLKSLNSPEDEGELKESLYHISESLNKTITDLNEIVTAQTKSIDDKQPVRFDDALQTVMFSVSQLISNDDVEIYSDFSEVTEIEYLPSYLESILLNLITNAIKYRHPDRKPVIDICTFEEDGAPCMQIRDNGLGIDLEKFGDRIFNMYQTFHNRSEAVGIGLFITKNQIETMQGSISIESVVNEGTTFKINF